MPDYSHVDDELEFFFSNPAGRLFRLLDAASQVGSQSQDSQPAINVWAKALGARSTDPLDFYPLFVEACKLPDQIEEAFRQAPKELGDSEPYLRYLGAFRNIIGPGSETNAWKQIRQQINPTVLYSIEMGARELAKYPTDDVVDSYVLDNLRSQISKLREDAEGADLEPDLQAFIHRHLHSLEDGLALYKIKGVDGLRESTFGIIGELIVRGTRGEFEGDDAKVSYYKKVYQFVAKILDIADKAQKVQSISAKAGPQVLALLDGLLN